MKKLAIFLLLLGILGVSGYTFYAIYQKQQAQPIETLVHSEIPVHSTTTPDYISTTVDETTVVTKTEDSINIPCAKQQEFVASLPGYGVDFIDPQSRFSISLPETLRYYKDPNDKDLQILTASDVNAYSAIKCGGDYIETGVGYYIDFRPNITNTGDKAPLTVEEVVGSVSIANQEVTIYQPIESFAGHLEATIEAPGGEITIFRPTLAPLEIETQIELMKEIIRGITIRKPEEYLREVTNWTDFISEDFYQPTLVYEAKDKVWFYKYHGTEGCNFLMSLHKTTGQYEETSTRSCAGMFFKELTPLFLNYCDDYYDLSACLNRSTLTALNLDTGKTVELFDTSSALKPGETFVQSCGETTYDQACNSEIRVEDKVMTISVFKERHKPTSLEGVYIKDQPLEFENEKVREITIDLSQFY